MYLCYIVYLLFTENSFHKAQRAPGPIQVTNMNLTGWLFMTLLIYSLISFLFVNNQYVLHRIKMQKDANRHEHLKLNYWLPMRKFVRTAVWICLGLMGFCVIIDAITLMK